MIIDLIDLLAALYLGIACPIVALVIFSLFILGKRLAAPRLAMINAAFASLSFFAKRVEFGNYRVTELIVPWSCISFLFLLGASIGFLLKRTTTAFWFSFIPNAGFAWLGLMVGTR
jgi:hypothetical protein